MDLAYIVIRDHLADKHLGDCLCPGTQLVVVRNSPKTILQTGSQVRYRIIDTIDKRMMIKARVTLVMD